MIIFQNISNTQFASNLTTIQIKMVEITTSLKRRLSLSKYTINTLPNICILIYKLYQDTVKSQCLKIIIYYYSNHQIYHNI